MREHEWCSTHCEAYIHGTTRRRVAADWDVPKEYGSMGHVSELGTQKCPQFLFRDHRLDDNETPRGRTGRH